MRKDEIQRLQAAWRHHEHALIAKGFSIEIRYDALEGWWEEIGSQSNPNPSFRPSPDFTQGNTAWIRLSFAGSLAGGVALRVYEWQGMPGPKVFQQGGLVVWPSYRGARAGYHLVHLIRLLGFLTFDCEQNIGLELAEMAETAMPLGYYEYARLAPVADNVEVFGDRVRIYMTHISRAEYLARLSADGEIIPACLAQDSRRRGDLESTG